MSINGFYGSQRFMGAVGKKKYGSVLKWGFVGLVFIFALPLYLLLTREEALPAPIVFTENLQIPVLIAAENKVVDMSLEEYCVGVLAGEMPASFEPEALRAQAMAARTFTMRQYLAMGKHDGKAAVCTDYHCCQAWQSDEQLREKWGENYEENLTKIRRAVADTEGMIITYENEPISAVYHSTCGDKTENAGDYWQSDVPYLKSVACGYDGDAPKLHTEAFFSYGDLAQRLGVGEEAVAAMAPIAYSDSGRVKDVAVGKKHISGVDLREQLQLASTNFTIEKKEGGIAFQVQGYGHGVGLCQYGANGMAKAGFTGEEIVKRYYTGVDIQNIYGQKKN